MKTVLPTLHDGARRRFLRCAVALLAGAAVSSLADRMSLAADADAQWARLQGGLSQKTMAGCRKAADRLMPRLGALLKGPQWEGQMFQAIAEELKQAGVYPDRAPPLSPDCVEALRGEAGSASSSGGAIGAAQAVAAATVATLPGIGSIIAAVVAVIAAVLILLGQMVAKAKEDEAAAKEREDHAAKITELKRKVTDETARRDDCVLFGKKPD